ncbi:MAG: aminoacyl-tRNA hydrolase [Coriobacteriia bacterium]
MARLVVGLGNPGAEYEHTRHNAGFMVVTLLGERLGASYWKDECGAKSAVVWLDDAEVALAMPQTFMNRSGRSVSRLLECHGAAVHEMIVVHDDIDLPRQTVRAKKGGGHGGHNGLRSLIEEIGDDSFLRVRVGVGRPPGRQDPADYVLEPLRGEALDELESCVPHAAQCVMHILEHGIESAMQEFNGG